MNKTIKITVLLLILIIIFLSSLYFYKLLNHKNIEGKNYIKSNTGTNIQDSGWPSF